MRERSFLPHSRGKPRFLIRDCLPGQEGHGSRVGDVHHPGQRRDLGAGLHDSAGVGAAQGGIICRLPSEKSSL